jgi:hypothetical protein
MDAVCTKVDLIGAAAHPCTASPALVAAKVRVLVTD